MSHLPHRVYLFGLCSLSLRCLDLTTVFHLKVRAYPHISKIGSRALFGGFVTYISKPQFISARKNPGVRFERVPDEAKFLRSERLSI